MCGISGLFYFDPSRTVEPRVVEAMRSVTRHRGPDDNGLHVTANVGLGFNRLSIIDLSGGHQPMANDDETVWLVFNGEIYNFAELRKTLQGRGYRFRTRSDTETILRAWEEYGEKCVLHLRGMFAFTIWDSRRAMLFSARDRLGIKPFYYWHNSELFCFASEIKSLLELPEVPRNVSAAALTQYLRHRYVIAPNTILEGVHKLPPAHTLTVSSAGVQVQRYWDIPTGDSREILEGDALEELSALLRDCVQSHLISDVPLGAFLSGGLDSSSIVALMHQLGAANIKTFSVGYESPESELRYARIVADHFHTDHHELVLTPSAFRDFLPKMIWSLDEPVGDEAAIPLYYLAQFARSHVTVALSGEGADEIFAGYPGYRRMLAYEDWNRLPFIGSVRRLGQYLPDGKLKKNIRLFGLPIESRYGGVSHVFPGDLVSRIFPGARAFRRPDRVQEAYSRCSDSGALGRMSYLDLTTWLPDDLLVKADRMSMANSLELRVPFLDHKLVEFATRLPNRLKIQGSSVKYLLKRQMEPLLPPAILARSKCGFPVPTKSWFRRELADYAREVLLASGSATNTFFQRKEVEVLLESHRYHDRGDQIYSLLVFDHWYRLFAKPQVLQFA